MRGQLMSASDKNGVQTIRTKERKGFMVPPIKMIMNLIIFAMFFAGVVIFAMTIFPGIKTMLMNSLGLEFAKDVIIGGAKAVLPK